MLNLSFIHITAARLAYFVPGILLAIAIRKILPWTWLRISFEFLGVFTHELFHLLIGYIVGARPVGGTLIPRRLPDGSWILGSVRFQNIRWFNGVFTGLAPMLIPFCFVPLIPQRWSLSSITKLDIFNWLLMALILPSSIPSKADMRIATRSAFSITLIASLILLTYFFIKLLPITMMRVA